MTHSGKAETTGRHPRRHHVLHEDHFFELTGSLTVEVEFIVTNQEAERLIPLLKEQNVRVFYAHIPARFGLINQTWTTEEG